MIKLFVSWLRYQRSDWITCPSSPLDHKLIRARVLLSLAPNTVPGAWKILHECLWKEGREQLGVTESPRVLIPWPSVLPLDHGIGCCWSMVLKVWSQEPPAPASIWNSLETQVLPLHPRPAESEPLGLWLSNLGFKKTSGWFWCTPKFDNHCWRKLFIICLYMRINGQEKKVNSFITFK